MGIHEAGLWATVVLGVLVGAVAAAERGPLRLDRLHEAEFRFAGVLGERVRANAEHWLLVTPEKNPGLLDMFARRDSGEKLNLVPWAGEFVGKYLISGVQALRMSDDPRLRKTLGSVVGRLISLQAEDGYLGPWPKAERLLGHWDLWGHYHVMLALMLWHEHTGDERALAACRKAADLVCTTYLDTPRRVHQAGSHEMNMSVIHGLARLHRVTGEARYLRMAQEILKDFEVAGDYYRAGLKGVEFHRTPRPRWESLHALQGLVELYRITGDASFRTAFLHHWASMRHWDLRNTGGFSSGEAATGDPYRNDAIETCCVVAWMAVMIDALRLTGDSTIADDLELATLNAIAGAQHPSGAWFTYSTPMAGKRVPSHVHISFQARPDTPFLNCCSVNGPRGLGMLSEWAVMRDAEGIFVLCYGPMEARLKLADGTPVVVKQETGYPLEGAVELNVEPAEPRRFALGLRVPAWSDDTRIEVNGEGIGDVRPGEFARVERTWQKGDRVGIRLDMRLRAAAGDLDQAGRASIYRGPVLLALDPRFSAVKTAIDVARLAEARRVAVDPKAGGKHHPWLLVDVPTTGGGTARLCDFANAGATGSEYATWLAAEGLAPPPPVPWQPRAGEAVPRGALLFRWRRSAAMKGRTFWVVVSDSPQFAGAVLRSAATEHSRVVVPAEAAAQLSPGKPYYWKGVARNAHGTAESLAPHKSFVVDPSLPPVRRRYATPYGERPEDKALALASLAGRVEPEMGTLLDAQGWKPAAGPDGKPNTAIALDGKTGRIRYALLAFPETDFTVGIRVCVERLPATQYGHVFSAWCRGMDDPLRLVVHQGKLHARVEAGRFYGTDGAAVEAGKWMHVAAVKQGAKLTLYVDGKPHASAKVPAAVSSGAEDFALGGNPHYGGPEFLAARLADLRFFARALSADEVARMARRR